jgi:plastocyanin
MLKQILFFALATLSLAVMASKEPKALIRITNFDFTPKKLVIPQGYTVIWNDDAGKHTVVADDGSFKSEILNKGDTYTHTFDKAGTFVYYCSFHGKKGGHEMSGTVIVQPRGDTIP